MKYTLHTLLYDLIGVIAELDDEDNWRGETNAQRLFKLLDDIECATPELEEELEEN